MLFLCQTRAPVSTTCSLQCYALLQVVLTPQGCKCSKLAHKIVIPWSQCVRVALPRESKASIWCSLQRLTMAGGPPPSQTPLPLLHPCLPQLRAALWHPSDQRILRQRHKAAAPPGERHTAGDAAYSVFQSGMVGSTPHLPVFGFKLRCSERRRGMPSPSSECDLQGWRQVSCAACCMHCCIAAHCRCRQLCALPPHSIGRSVQVVSPFQALFMQPSNLRKLRVYCDLHQCAGLLCCARHLLPHPHPREQHRVARWVAGMLGLGFRLQWLL